MADPAQAQDSLQYIPYISNAITVVVIFGFVKYFINRLTKRHDTHDANYKELNTKIDKETKDLRESFKKDFEKYTTQAREDFKAYDTKFERTNMIVASMRTKLELLDTFSRKLESLSAKLSRQSDSMLFMKNEIIKAHRNINRIWDYIKQLELQVVATAKRMKEVPEPDISHILTSNIFSEREKEAVVDYIQQLTEYEPYKIKMFVEFLEDKLENLKIKKQQGEHPKSTNFGNVTVVDDDPKSKPKFKRVTPEDKGGTKEFTLEEMDEEVSSYDHVSSSILKDKNKKD